MTVVKKKDESAKKKEEKKNEEKAEEPVKRPSVVKKKPSTAAAGPKLNADTEKAMDHFVQNVTEKKITELSKEFEEISQKPPGDFMAVPKNGKKYPADSVEVVGATRVVLPISERHPCDFFHANKVKLKNIDTTYVLAAAPTEDTKEEFWKTLFQEQCTFTIVMCNFHEEDWSCPQFWPLEPTKFANHGTMFVACKKVDHENQYSIYTLEVLPEGCSNSLITRLTHVTTFPPKNLPKSGRMLLRALKGLHAEKETIASIAIVCSDGASRSGTMLAIEAATQRFNKGHDVKIHEIAKDIRNQRAYAIGCLNNYLFIHTTILDYVKIKCPKKYDKAITKFYQEANAYNRNVNVSKEEEDSPPKKK